MQTLKMCNVIITVDVFVAATAAVAAQKYFEMAVNEFDKSKVRCFFGFVFNNSISKVSQSLILGVRFENVRNTLTVYYIWYNPIECDMCINLENVSGVLMKSDHRTGINVNIEMLFIVVTVVLVQSSRLVWDCKLIHSSQLLLLYDTNEMIERKVKIGLHACCHGFTVKIYRMFR